MRVLDAVVGRDAARALALADEMNGHSLSFAQALRDLASLLHRVALAQQVAAVDEDDIDAAEVKRLARTIAPDEVQLYYQIALHGRNDLHLAPDEYAGFTMTLLRMIAFAPNATAPVPAPRAAPLVSAAAPRATVAAPARGASAAAASTPAPPTQPALAATAVAAPPVTFDGNWPALVARLNVAGLVKELAQRSELVSAEGDHFRLRAPLKTLIEAGTVDKLKAALATALGRPVRVTAEVGNTTGPTAAGLAAQASSERQRQAEEAIYGDPFVRELIDNFGASVDPASIRPRDGNDTGTKR